MLQVNNITEKQIKDYKNAILSAIPADFNHLKDYIEFKPYKPAKLARLQVPVIPVAEKPLEFAYKNDIYRIIPSYPAYAITNYGKIINYYTKQELETKLQGGYISVTLQEPFTRELSLTTVHRLVAMAWVPNDDYVKKNVVDHIDNNKLNNKANNLRWVSPRTNIAKVTSNGLDKRWVALNLKTKKTEEFESLAEVEEKLGIKRNFLQSTKCPYLIKDKKGNEWILDDKLNFSNFGATRPITGLGNKILYQLFVDDKLVKTYDNIMDIIKDHGNSGRLSFRKLKDFIKKYYSKRGKKANLVELREKQLDECYQAKNLETGEIVTGKNYSELGRKIGVDRRIVYQRFNLRPNIPYGKWIFKKCSDPDFPEIKAPENKKKKVILKNDKEVLEFESLRKAAEYLKIDRKTLSKRMKAKTPVNGYTIEIEN